MKNYSQLELEKIIEHLYDLQCEDLTTEEIEQNRQVLETRHLLMFLQDENKKMLDKKFKRQIKRC